MVKSAFLSIMVVLLSLAFTVPTFASDNVISITADKFDVVEMHPGNLNFTYYQGEGEIPVFVEMDEPIIMNPEDFNYTYLNNSDDDLDDLDFEVKDSINLGSSWELEPNQFGVSEISKDFIEGQLINIEVLTWQRINADNISVGLFDVNTKEFLVLATGSKIINTTMYIINTTITVPYDASFLFAVYNGSSANTVPFMGTFSW